MKRAADGLMSWRRKPAVKGCCVSLGPLALTPGSASPASPEACHGGMTHYANRLG